MDDIDVDNQKPEDEVTPLPRQNPRRQRQQLRFAEEEVNEEEKQQKSPTSFKPPGRASRFLSIYDPSIQLPSAASLLRLRQLHSQATNAEGSSIPDEISDELLDKIPFQYDSKL